MHTHGDRPLFQLSWVSEVLGGIATLQLAVETMQRERGTGCRLASAMAGLLARGASLPDAVRGAKRVVERYLDAAGRA